MGTLISKRSFGSSMALRNSTCNSARVSFTLLLAVVGVCIVWLCCGRLHDSSREVTTFVPPLGFHFLTSLYDSVVALTRRESSFRQSLVEQCVQILQKAHVGARCSTLEIGCGTGSLLKVLADSLPTDCTVAGVDIDEKALHSTPESWRSCGYLACSSKRVAFRCERLCSCFCVACAPSSRRWSKRCSDRGCTCSWSPRASTYCRVGPSQNSSGLGTFLPCPLARRIWSNFGHSPWSTRTFSF